MLKKTPIPQHLNICFVASHFRVLSRHSDSGFIFPIARGLAKLGHQVTVLSTTSSLGESEIVRDGVKVYYLLEGQRHQSISHFQNVAKIKFAELHAQSPFHIVHSLDRSGYRIGKARKEFSVAMAYDIEATQISQIFSILGMKQDTIRSYLQTGLAVAYKFLTTYYGGDSQLLASADGLFVTNPQQRLMLERYYMYPDWHIYQVPYGADVGDMSPKEKSFELRRKWGIPDNAHIAVTVSEMHDALEMQYVLRGFERVAVKKPNSYLFLLGQGPKFKDIEFEVLNLALGSRVIMTGAISNTELADYVALGDVFVDMTSTSTGFEAAMVEAMAQKKIIIGSEVSSMAHFIEDGQDGFLIRPADYESLGSLILEIFSGTMPSDEIGERARQKVLDLFDSKKMTEAVLDAYRNILVKTGRYRVE